MGLLDMDEPTCNPSPDTFNTEIIAKGNGLVIITMNYGWDGVSVFPNCAGPIISARIQNMGPDTWMLRLPNGKQSKNNPVVPGTDATLTGSQLTALGVTQLADIRDMTLVKV